MRVAAVTIACILVGCAAITSFDGFVGDGSRAPDAGSPDLDAAGTADAGCGRKWPPKRTGKGGGDLELEGAVTSLRFSAGERDPPLGFDLDDRCTCLETEPGKEERGSCRSASKGPCDVRLGIDNAAELIFLNPAFGLDAERLQQRLRSGEHGFAIRVSRWNGEADDEDVTAEVFNVVSVDGGGVIVDGHYTGKGRGTSTLGSLFSDTSAYVAGGVLVAKLVEYRLRLVANSARTGGGDGGDGRDAGADGGREALVLVQPVVSPVLVGRIEREGDKGLVMRDAQLVGRLDANALLTASPTIGLCRDAGLYPIVKGQLCAYRDIHAIPATPEEQPCNALSFALGMDVAPARIVDDVRLPPSEPKCPDDVDTSDTCE